MFALEAIRCLWGVGSCRRRQGRRAVGKELESEGLGLKRLRVVLIALHFAEYSIALARALSVHHNVLLILSRNNFVNEVGDERVFDGFESLQVEFISHTRNPLGILPRAIKLVSLIRDFQADVLHCQESSRDYLALALPLLGSAPFVLTVHDPRPHSGLDSVRRNRSRHGLYVRQMRRRADLVLVHGAALVAAAEQEMPRLASRIFNVPHGPLGVLASQPLNTDWQVGNCLFFGRVEQYKGLPYFVQALRLLQDEGVPVHGVIAGRGTDLDRLSPTLINDPGFTVFDRYMLPAEVIDCFQAAHVVVAPYLDATQSGVLSYAHGLGRPIVATEVGSLPDAVQDGINGFLVPPGDARTLADAVRTIVLDPARSRAMAKASADLATGPYSWQAIALLTDRAYRQAIADVQPDLNTATRG